MDTAIRKTIMDALRNHKGDNLARADSFWTGLSTKILDAPHGQSGRTKREIWEGYRRHVATVDAASAWVQEQA